MAYSADTILDVVKRVLSCSKFFVNGNEERENLFVLVVVIVVVVVVPGPSKIRGNEACTVTNCVCRISCELFDAAACITA